VQQAHDILARWDTTVTESPHKPAYAPTYDMEMLDDSAQILSGRPLVLGTQVPLDAPSAQLRWPDGATRTVVGLTAPQAFDELVRYAAPLHCPGCAAAHVTGAHIVTRTLEAVGGPVTVPLWEFTFAEYPDHAFLPAVAPDELLLPRPMATGAVGTTPFLAWTDP